MFRFRFVLSLAVRLGRGRCERTVGCMPIVASQLRASHEALMLAFVHRSCPGCYVLTSSKLEGLPPKVKPERVLKATAREAFDQ